MYKGILLPDMRVADYIAGRLKEAGVQCVFMVSGGGMMHLIDAVPRVGLRYVCNHHEQACAMAAEGYARQTNSLGVCYATSGPGATNILTGLVGAWQDSSPVLFLTGQSNVHQSIKGSGIADLRQFGTFEVNIVPIVQSVTKYAVFLDDPRAVRRELEKAIWLATSGRPGPVLIDIPLNVQGAPVDPSQLEGFTPPAPASADHLEEVAQVLDRLCAAQRPLLLLGHGVRCAGERVVKTVRALAETLQIPVVTTQLGKDIFPYDHPLFVGHPGVKGDRAGNFAVQHCDVMLVMGSSLHLQTTGYDQKRFAPHAYVIHVDPDKAVLQRQQGTAAMQVQSELSPFVSALQDAVRTSAPDVGNVSAAWRDQCLAWKQELAVMKEPHLIDDGPVNLYAVADTLSDLLTGDETILTDSGCSFYVMGQAFRCKQNERYIVSGALGAMGYVLPAAIGVATADPNRTIVCVTGEGALQMNVQELQTLRQEQFNVKLIIINNDGYASIRSTQKSFFDGYFVGSDRTSGLSTPSLQKLADAYELSYVHCPDAVHLRECLRRTLSSPGPVMCDVSCQFDQQIIPSVTSVRLPDGRMESKDLQDMFPFLVQQVGEQELRKTDG